MTAGCAPAPRETLDLFRAALCPPAPGRLLAQSGSSAVCAATSESQLNVVQTLAPHSLPHKAASHRTQRTLFEGWRHSAWPAAFPAARAPHTRPPAAGLGAGDSHTEKRGRPDGTHKGHSGGLRAGLDPLLRACTRN